MNKEIKISSLIEEIKSAGITLFIKDGRLASASSEALSITPEIKEKISFYKNEIINHLKKSEISAISEKNSILSFSQQRMWVLDKIENNSSHYNIQANIKIFGHLDLDILEKCFFSIIDRHHILKTNYYFDDIGNPYQTISHQEKKIINIIDTSVFGKDENIEIINNLLKEGAEYKFDLSKDLMIKVNAYKLTNEGYILQIVIHHIAFDGWSSAILINEVSQLYSAYINGQTNPLKTLSVQYRDYAFWQRNWLFDEVISSQLPYWLKKLNNIPQLHSLPLDYPRPSIQSHKGKSHISYLKMDTVDALNQICRSHRTTLFTGLYAAFSLLLSKYSGQFDIIMGSPIANRDNPKVSELIGFFVNTIVLRNDLSENPSFKQLIDQCSNILIEAYSHQQVPFEKIVESIQPDRNMSSHPIFQIMLAFQNTRQGSLHLQNITMTPINTKRDGIAKYDLTLEIQELPNGLELNWEYSTDIFKHETISRMAKHFDLLLSKIIKNPETAVFDHSITIPEEIELYKSINLTKKVLLVENKVHKLFEKQVDRYRKKSAIIFGDNQLSYEDLNSKSNQLANFLIKNNIIIDGDIVGICMDRSPELIIAILAVLKAGGTYAPIDSNYPTSRKKYMIDDMQSKIVISKLQYKNDLSFVNKKILYWEDENFQSELTLASHLNIKNTNDFNNSIANVIYTSGSTGNPKGVKVNHSGIINLVTNQNYITLSSSSVIAQLSNMSFDAMTFELWGALLNGGTLVYLPLETVLEAKKLRSFVKKNNINTVLFTTALLQSIITDYLYAIADIEYILFGGEDCSLNILRKFFEKYPNKELINAYGPSENTTISTFKKLNIDYISKTEKVAIGIPITNNFVYVLDQYRHLVPIGIKGELYVGGTGLSNGYLHNIELTKEKFIDNPFYDEKDSISSQKLYKTGDLVRLLENGDIEFWGRIDTQVKIRGFRIELGEIENILVAHPEVKEACVIAKSNLSNSKQLIAFIVSQISDSEILKNHLATYLPEYMLPSHYIFLESLPITHNGKINTQALDSLAIELPSSIAYAPPQTKTEHALTKIWSNILNIEITTLSINGNFFELGGHSLLATRVTIQIQQAMDVEISVRDIFEYPTISKLAKIVENHSYKYRLPAITKNLTDGSISYAQERLWFLNLLEGARNAYIVPAVYRLNGELSVKSLEKSFQEILSRHEILRTNIAMNRNGDIYQKIKNTYEYYIDIHNVTSEKDNFLYKKKINELLTKPFDLTIDNLIRVSLIEKGNADYILVIVMHHIITDGWSMGIFIEELSQLYNAYVNNTSPSLQPVEIQYQDYSNWQRNLFENEVIIKQISYWQEKLKDIPVIELPTDRPRPSVQSYKGNWIPIEIPETTISKLKKIGQAQECTIFMSLISIFNLLLYRYTYQKTLCVGTPVANRLKKEIEPLIGLFVNTLALRIDLDDQISFIELLKKVKETVISAYDNQLVPFEKIVEKIQPERSQSYSPLFQTMFILQNTNNVELSMNGLEVSYENIEWATSKFDLTFSLKELPNGKIEGGIEYATDLFDESTVKRMFTHYVEIINQVSINPLISIGKIDFLSTEEKSKQLVEWNNTEKIYKNHYVHQLFENIADCNPEAIAIEYQNHKLTYQQLNIKSNQFAHYLKNVNKITNQSPIGIYLDRSIDMVIAILGVLKAGGAYLPLDPDYPPARLKYMVDNSNASILVTQRNLYNKEFLFNESICTFLDEIKLDNYPIFNINPEHVDLTPNCLAYIIYTSGSTGMPKGVMVEHKNLINFLYSINERPGFTSKDILCAITPISFDIHVLEIFSPLINGAKLIVMSKMANLDPKIIVDTINKSNVSVFQATPSTFRMLLDYGWQPYSPIKILCGGEKLPISLNNDLTCIQNIELWNMYGPTETTVWSLCEKRNTDWLQSSIGKPIQNTQIYIFDHNSMLVPVGVSGELHIGGLGVSRGYLNREDLTKEKFIDNPFYNPENFSSSKQLYKTGDLCRYLADGTVEFLGRIDHQIKIRGFRIEVGEIENALISYQDINGAIVTANGHDDNAQLVAYIVLKNNSDFDSDEYKNIFDLIKKHLHGYLPNYMVPNIFIPLHNFPLTPNGKIDRKLLPKPELNNNHSNFVPPLTNLEKQLASIWKKLLNTDIIGIYDNFFNLGGHSLLAVKLLTKMQEIGVDVLMTAFMRNPTINGIMLSIEKTDLFHYNYSYTENDNIVSLPNKQLLFTSMFQNHWNVRGLVSIKDVNIDFLNKAIAETLFEHQGLFHFFHNENGKIIENINFNYNNPILEILDLSNIKEAIDKSKIIESTSDRIQKSLSLNNQLFRFILFHDTKSDSRFLWTIHHSVMDGYSVGIFLHELLNRYLSYIANRAFTPLTKTIPMTEWGHYLSYYFNSGPGKNDIDYWLSLPFNQAGILMDFPEGIEKNQSGNHTLYGNDIVITENIVFNHIENLNTIFIKNREISIVDIILSSFSNVISKLTHSSTVYFEIISNGRDKILHGIDLSRTVGWLNDFPPVVINVNHDLPNDDQAVSYRKQYQSMPHAGLGFHALRCMSNDSHIRDTLNAIPRAEFNINFLPLAIKEFDKSTDDLPTYLVSEAPEFPGEPHNASHCDIIWPSYVHIEQTQDNAFMFKWITRDNMYKYETVELAMSLWIKEVIKTIDKLL